MRQQRLPGLDLKPTRKAAKKGQGTGDETAGLSPAQLRVMRDLCPEDDGTSVSITLTTPGGQKVTLTPAMRKRIEERLKGNG